MLGKYLKIEKKKKEISSKNCININGECNEAYLTSAVRHLGQAK